MSEQGFEAIGVDLAKTFLEIAKRKIPQGNFRVADISDLSQFEDDTFDGILANCSLQHIPAELLNQTLNGFNRVLKPNGQLLIILPASELGEHMIDEPYRPGKKLYVNYLSLEQMEILLLQNHLNPTVSKTASVISQNEIGEGKLIFQSTNKKSELSDDNRQPYKRR